ncbi:gamma-tubulin complex component 5-like [Sycon ciliatum]|uniref:gamma-tubulin complex component 5-like n=1 Tax=Sycon ciliatum TaxID=27933 RepID=UPI0031F6CB2B
MSRQATKHQRRQERLAEQLVSRVTGLDDGDVNFSTALQYVVSSIVYHRFLDASRNSVERSVDGLCTKFKVHVQQEKSDKLRQLVDEFLRRDLRSNSAKSECHYAILAFLLHVSESPLRSHYTPEDWTVPDDSKKELSAAEWYKILHEDDEMPVAFSSGSDLEPWSSSEDDDDEQAPQTRTSVTQSRGENTVYESTGDPGASSTSLRSAQASAELTPSSSSLQSLTVAQQSSLTAHHRSVQRKSFIRSQLTHRYWQQSPRHWPVTELAPGDWLGKDHLLSALCCTAQLRGSILHAPPAHYDVTEQKAVRETIWCLCGSTQLFVYVARSNGGVSPRPHVQVPHFTEESLRRALQRFANVANKLTYVRQFVTDALQYPASGKGQPCGPSRPSHAATRGASATTTTQHPPTTGAPPAAVGSDNGWHGSPVGNGCCQTVQAFASAVNEHVGVLTGKLCDLEELNRTSESCRTLLQLRMRVADMESKIDLLYDLVTRGVRYDFGDNRQVSCHLINTIETILADMSLYGAKHIDERNMVISVLLMTVRPYMAMVEQWMTYGSLVDPYKECLIMQSDSLSADPSLDFSAHWWRDAFTLWKAAPSRSVTSSSSVQQPSSSVDGERKTQATDGDVMKRGGDVITRDGDVTAETRNVVAIPELFQQSISQALQAGKSLCLLRTLEKISTGTVHASTLKEPQTLVASLFQEFLTSLQRRLLNIGDTATLADGGGGDGLALDSTPSNRDDLSCSIHDDATSIATTTSGTLSSLDSLSVGSVQNFDIDREFQRADTRTDAPDTGYVMLPRRLQDDFLSLPRLDALASDRTGQLQSPGNVSMATCSSISPQRSASSSDGLSTGLTRDSVDFGSQVAKAMPSPSPGYLSALAPNALLGRNFASLTTVHLGNSPMQRQLATLQRSKVTAGGSGGGVLQSSPCSRAHYTRTHASSHTSPSVITSSHGTITSSHCATTSSACSTISSSTDNDRSFSVESAGDTDDASSRLESIRRAVLNSAQRGRTALSSAGGGGVGVAVAAAAAGGAVELFSDDLSAVTRLINTLPLYHVPFSIALNSSLPPLLHRRSDAICKQLADVLRNKYSLASHLKHLQSYFLMEAGATMHHFSASIFQQICAGEDWLRTSNLNALLHEALSYSNECDEISSLLSIDIVQPQMMPASSSSTATSTAASKRRVLASKLSATESTAFGFDRLSLLYRTEWPVDIVVSEKALDDLNRVFRFLLHLKFAKWSLDNCFWQDTDLSRACGADSPIYKRAFLLRVKLLHVVNAIHSYIMTRILHSVGNEYMSRLATVEDLDSIIECFDSFVNLVLDRCLLGPETSFVREAVLKLLRQAVLFRQLCTGGLERMSLERINAMLTECDKCHTFLLGVFNGIIRRGAFPHLEALALSLAWKT